MMIAALAGTLASATPVSSPDARGFVVDNGDLVVAIELSGAPLPAAVGPLHGHARGCPVGIEVERGEVVVRPAEDCHPLVFGRVSEAVAAWTVRTTGRPGPDRLAGEVLFVFGHDEEATDPDRTALYVVPQATTTFTITSDRVQRYPIRADAIAFPGYPVAAPDDTRVARCSVRLEVDRYGTAVDIGVTRCDDVFVDPTRRAFERWHFTERRDDELPYRLVRFGATYGRTPDGGTVTVNEPAGIRVDVGEIVDLGTAEPAREGFEAVPRRRTVPRLSSKAQATVRERTICRFDVRVDARGRPAEISPSDCPEPLVEPATKAIRRWRWAPATREGAAVASSTTVSLRFDPAADR